MTFRAKETRSSYARSIRLNSESASDNFRVALTGRSDDCGPGCAVRTVRGPAFKRSSFSRRKNRAYEEDSEQCQS
jgi:hypothetical protein